MSFVGGADLAVGAGEPTLAAADAWNACADCCSFRLLTACIRQTTTIRNKTLAAAVLQEKRWKRFSSWAHHCWQYSLVG
jgi:hypothetical protein